MVSEQLGGVEGQADDEAKRLRELGKQQQQLAGAEARREAAGEARARGALCHQP